MHVTAHQFVEVDPRGHGAQIVVCERLGRREAEGMLELAEGRNCRYIFTLDSGYLTREGYGTVQSWGKFSTKNIM